MAEDEKPKAAQPIPPPPPPQPDPRLITYIERPQGPLSRRESRWRAGFRRVKA